MTKKLPSDSDILFLLADLARNEAGGKMTLMGLYTDGAILIPNGTALPVNLQLVFYYLVKAGEGDFKADFRVIAPSGKQVAGGVMPNATKEKNKPLTLLLQFPVITLPELGTYNLELILDSSTFIRQINLAVE